MSFDKQEVDRFNGFNSNVAPELLKDEDGTARDILNFRAERIGKLTTRNGYGIAAYGEAKSNPITGKMDLQLGTMFYLKNGGVLAIGEMIMSHKSEAFNTDRFMVYYIRGITSNPQATPHGIGENDDNRKFKQIKNTAYKQGLFREHLASFVFVPIVNGIQHNIIIQNGLFYDEHQGYLCDLDPQSDGFKKRLYASMRDLSDDSGYSSRDTTTGVTNIGHQVWSNTIQDTDEDNYIYNYADMAQYRFKLIVSDKINGDMCIENIWDKETDKDEADRVDGIKIRANCLEDFDINHVYLDSRLNSKQENSVEDGVTTGMALYNFELEKKTMRMTNPLDEGLAASPDNYKWTSDKEDTFPSDDTVASNFFAQCEDVMLANITYGGKSWCRVLDKKRFFSNADANTQYADLLSNLKLSEFEYYDDKEKKTIKSASADVYIWEDMQIKYYPSKGSLGLTEYISSSDRFAEQTNSGASRLVDIEEKKGLGTKTPIGGWRYRFVWDFGNGDYSAPSTEMLCPDMMWSAMKDSDIKKESRNNYKLNISNLIEKNSCKDFTSKQYYPIQFYPDMNIGYDTSVYDSVTKKYTLTETGKRIFDIKKKLYEGIQGKFGLNDAVSYNSNGEVILANPSNKWESYDYGDFAATVMLKSPKSAVELRGVIAQFVALDHNGKDNNVDDYYITKDTGYSDDTNCYATAIYKLNVPTFPYESSRIGYENVEYFTLMQGIFDFYGRYRMSWLNTHDDINKFIVMPNYIINKLTQLPPDTYVVNSTTEYKTPGIFYGGTLLSYKTNHSNKFYLNVDGGCEQTIVPILEYRDFQNITKYTKTDGSILDTTDYKPETMLRAYFNDTDSPIIFNREVPSEVTSRIMLTGQAELKILQTQDSAPFVPCKSIKPEDYDKSINILKDTDNDFIGWDKKFPTLSKKFTYVGYFIVSKQKTIMFPNYGVPYPKDDLCYYMNPDNPKDDGIYKALYLEDLATGNLTITIKYRASEYPFASFNGSYFVADKGKVVQSIHDSGYGILNNNPYKFSTYVFNPSGSFDIDTIYSVEENFQYGINSTLFDSTKTVTSNTEISVYLPGHRSTILEQLSVIMPSSLLYKSPRMGIKIPNCLIPKTAKKLLVFRTLNSLTNEYDPTSYGLVDTIDIRRVDATDCNRYDGNGDPILPLTGKRVEVEFDGNDSTAELSYLTLDEKTDIGRVITTDYTYADGTGGKQNDCYDGIYFFDDKRDTILDFSSSPDTYEGLRYALKSRFNIAVNERMYYGNAIQQYQPEQPRGFGTLPITQPTFVGGNNIVSNTSYITAKAEKNGIIKKNSSPATKVQYAYVFEDEMGIKSQVALTKEIDLFSNSIDNINTGARDIALYFIPSSYTAGIKYINVYRKILDDYNPADNNKCQGFYLVSKIEREPDIEGVFVDDGLSSGVELPYKKEPLGWVFDTPPNTQDYESGVFYSEPYRPDFIKMQNFMEFGSGDGSQITGLESLYGNIVAFKEASIHRAAVQAEEPPISRVDMVSANEGCIAPNTLINVQDTLYFLSNRGFSKYDNNVIKSADDAFNDELMFLMANIGKYRHEASCGYNPYFDEIYLNIPKLKGLVKWWDIAAEEDADFVKPLPNQLEASIVGNKDVMTDVNEADHYDTIIERNWIDPDLGGLSNNSIQFKRQHNGHVFIINEKKGYNSKFGYPATIYKKLSDGSGFFPNFVHHSMHLVRKYFTNSQGVMVSGDVIPHWYGLKPNNVKTELMAKAKEVADMPPIFWAGLYMESPAMMARGKEIIGHKDSGSPVGSLIWGYEPYSDYDHLLNHRKTYDLVINGNNNLNDYPFKTCFPKITNIRINNVYKSKYYTLNTEMITKRLRSLGVNMFSKESIKIFISNFICESIDSALTYQPIDDFLSTSPSTVKNTSYVSKYNFPPTIDSYNHWSNVVTNGTNSNLLYIVPDTRMSGSNYEGTITPFNDDAGKPIKFSIEIYSKGKTQLNALTYHIRNIWSYLR